MGEPKADYAGVPVAATEGAVGTAAQNVGTVGSMAGSGGGEGGRAEAALAAPGAATATANNVAALRAAALRAARSELPGDDGQHVPAVTDAAAAFFAANGAGHVRN